MTWGVPARNPLPESSRVTPISDVNAACLLLSSPPLWRTFGRRATERFADPRQGPVGHFRVELGRVPVLVPVLFRPNPATRETAVAEPPRRRRRAVCWFCRSRIDMLLCADYPSRKGDSMCTSFA